MAWQTQSLDNPLFPDLIWSRPENKRHAGKLLIVGGQAQEFSHIAAAYQAAAKAGAGSIKTILPDSLTKLAGAIPDVQFAPANKSGSFAHSALAELIDYSTWADHVLLAGNFGKNSETTVMLDSFLTKTTKPLTIAPQALPSIGQSLSGLSALKVNLIFSFSDLQKLGSTLKTTKPFVSTMSNQALGNLLAETSQSCEANIIASHENQTWVASRGDVTNTPTGNADPAELAAYCAVWHMQHPAKPLEALTTACYQLGGPRSE